MKHQSIARLLSLLLLMTLALPAGTAFATERGARLDAEGTTTMVVNGTRVAASRQLESLALIGSGFAAGELIGVWGTLPNGAVLGIDDDDIAADSTGAFAIEVGINSFLPTGLYRFSARGQRSGRGGIVPFFVMPGTGPTPTAGTQLVIAPGRARQLDTVEVAGTGFRASEQIAAWLTLPDGSVISAGRIPAAADGSFGLLLTIPGFLPVGQHLFTARGVTSGNTAITAFTVLYGNGLDVPGAELAAYIGRLQQRSFIEVTGEGFTPRETVDFWLTLPDGSVLFIGEVATDGSGNLGALIYLAEFLPVGTYYLSFRGNVSGELGFARLILDPGPQDPGNE